MMGIDEVPKIPQDTDLRDAVYQNSVEIKEQISYGDAPKEQADIVPQWTTDMNYDNGLLHAVDDGSGINNGGLSKSRQSRLEIPAGHLYEIWNVSEPAPEEIGLAVFKSDTSAGDELRHSWAQIEPGDSDGRLFSIAYKEYAEGSPPYTPEEASRWDFMYNEVFREKIPEASYDGTVTSTTNSSFWPRANHEQGIDSNYENTCAIACVTEVLRSHGYMVNEDDVTSRALTEGLDILDDSGPWESGRMYNIDIANLLGSYKVAAICERDQSIDQLADKVDQGHGVIVLVDAGRYYDDDEMLGFGHAVLVTEVFRDEHSGQVLGFHINDTNLGEDGKLLTQRYHESASLQYSWAECSGQCIRVLHSRTPNTGR